jgi:hypothetical protein
VLKLWKSEEKFLVKYDEDGLESIEFLRHPYHKQVVVKLIKEGDGGRARAFALAKAKKAAKRRAKTAMARPVEMQTAVAEKQKAGMVQVSNSSSEDEPISARTMTRPLAPLGGPQTHKQTLERTHTLTTKTKKPGMKRSCEPRPRHSQNPVQNATCTPGRPSPLPTQPRSSLKRPLKRKIPRKKGAAARTKINRKVPRNVHTKTPEEPRTNPKPRPSKMNKELTAKRAIAVEGAELAPLRKRHKIPRRKGGGVRILKPSKSSSPPTQKEQGGEAGARRGPGGMRSSLGLEEKDLRTLGPEECHQWTLRYVICFAPVILKPFPLFFCHSQRKVPVWQAVPLCALWDRSAQGMVREPTHKYIPPFSLQIRNTFHYFTSCCFFVSWSALSVKFINASMLTRSVCDSVCGCKV